MRLSCISAALVIAALHAAIARADVRVAASVDPSRVELRGRFAFTIRAEGTREDPNVELPDFKSSGLELLGGPSIRRERTLSGSMAAESESSSATYILRATRSGELTIPPMKVSVAGKKFLTNPISIHVSDKPATDEGDVGGSFIAELYVEPMAYVGQCLPLVERIVVSSRLSMSNLGLDPPAFPGFVEKPIDKQFRRRTGSRGGVPSVIFEKRSVLIPIREGDATIGPLVVRGELPVRSRRSRDPFFDIDDFFGTGETRPVTTQSEPRSISVLPLPSEGRPNGFTGAVGRFTMKASASPTTVAAGDPVTLTLTIAGQGNVEALSMPEVPPIQGVRAYDPERKVALDENADTLRGSVTFTQALVPSKPGPLAIPVLAFSFFDVEKKRYEIVDAGPFPITVTEAVEPASGLVSAAPGANAADIAIVGKDLLPLKTSPGSFVAAGPSGSLDSGALALLAGLPLLTAVAWMVRRRADRLRADPLLARSRRAGRVARERLADARRRKGEPGADLPGEVSHILIQYLGDKLAVPAPSLVGPEARTRLTANGIGESLAGEIIACIEACDRARYGRVDNQNGAALFDTAEHLIRSVEEASRGKAGR